MHNISVTVNKLYMEEKLSSVTLAVYIITFNNAAILAEGNNTIVADVAKHLVTIQLDYSTIAFPEVVIMHPVGK